MMFSSKPLSTEGKFVLITGASSGLGQETALQLSERGFEVIAGVRRQADGEQLIAQCPSGRISVVLVDVTDEDSIKAAATNVSARVGAAGLWGLINNAGICVSAPLECVSSDLLRKQLEVNLIGQLAVTRAFLPLLRQSNGARLVNITSGLGSVAIPYLGAYSAAQFAKEGLSDALRRELAPMGIAVSVVSPGAIWTPIWDKISAEGERALASVPEAIASLYRETYLRFLKGNEQGARNSLTQPADVAGAVFVALTASKPKTRYRVGADVRRGTMLAWLLPDAMVDKMFRPIVTPAPAEKEVQRV
ncbi:SDR family NAD(P)-dependent oxidoreductase [Pseudomonas sp. ICBG1301]|uniref:SDR family NAD(P)-dependent oxidoreductase n=1 Tax=Pseudomonas sp. ICBG1301 TaxID=2795987 RepID=UPI000F878A29|nr:SDR family NAD(P)-dependent oxidoreductase [Pseudomonas sp. ICBG1301]MBM9488831.1 SDR family NAD(P)-dependent oxidoreductase [Pseudomonas sp. ICBG1301]RUQ46816.1 SDR family NAD(P)-dependent oxidoreductase [Corynebacterium pseudodiphtheriticum]